ncbi:hypothetical protein PAHAL_5G345500 [Panicum hallii]|uniref:Uncharacterized protein n=1 Tax=Panicum hallii TaxID=206008 RepID=A0A2T8IM49_9POAL|nr:hypothetical protein PAHAL_5G345500 [Panicum hallii]
MNNFWSHKNLVITSIAIHETQHLMTSSRINQRFRNRHRVLIFWCRSVEIPKVYTDSPPAILLLYRHNTGNPFSIPASSDEACFYHLFDFFLDFFQDFGLHLLRSLLERPKSWLEREPMLNNTSVQPRHLCVVPGKIICIFF